MKSQSFEVALVPAATTPERLEGRAVIVVDVLRATSTIASALSAGADCIAPQPGIEAARTHHERLGPESRLGGERGGRRVDGFHCGNSPREYTPENIGGRTLILATTNGTVAMESCRLASLVITGAFANISAVFERVKDEPEITILCSGTDRRITSEDVLFAGAMAERILSAAGESGHELKMNDSATIAHQHWQFASNAIRSGEKTLADFFRVAHGGVNLVRNGYEEDVIFAANLDTFDVVPVLDLKTWTIRAE
ncbi:MAG: 2-phosphosulfolactate phosphatase [Planctomycetota bacterium]